jgi:hypothetical protein
MSAAPTPLAVALAAEIEIAASGRKKRASKPRPPPRPYKTLTTEVLAFRINRLTARLDKAKRQHETTRSLLTKYAHERFFRERETIELAAAAPEPPPTIEALEPQP